MAGRILVIDDSPELVGFFASVLQPLGYEVIPAYTGEEGLSRFRGELPDLVFLDLMLPHKQGSDVATEIKATDHGLITPVVLMSGEARGASRVDLMRTFGVVDFLVKPIPVAKITHLAEWILGGRSDEEVVPAADPELDRFDLSPGAEGVLPIADAGLLLALRLAAEERLTGTVVAARGRHRRALVLESGRIVGARSNAPADRVDRILVAMRRATPGQMSALRDQIFAPGADPLTVLARNGVIDAAARETVLRYQAMTVALTLFRWSEGSLRLLEGEAIGADRLSEPIPTSRLLLLGLRKSREARERAAQPYLAEPGAVLRPVSDEARALAAVALTRRERELFDLVDGRRTLGDLRALGQLAQMPVDDVLAVIAGAGLIEPAPPSSQGPGAARTLSALQATGEHITGDLAMRPLVEVVGLLSRTSATGILHVEHSARRQFAFEGGEIVFARSSDAGDRLGQVLLNEGRIDVDVLERALAAQRLHLPNRRLGSILVEQGELSITALEQAVRFQVMKILESSFGWTEGTFVFEPSDRGLGASVRLGLGLLDIARMGVNRLDVPALRRRLLGGVEECFIVATTGEPGALPLAPNETAILDLAPGRPSVEELVAGDGRDAVVLRAVELLVVLGLIELHRRERRQALPPRPPMPEIANAAAPRPESSPVLEASSSSGDETDACELLPVVVLEPDPEPAPSAGPALDRMLGFLRDELIAGRDRAEREARALATEVGELRERVRQLEADNRQLREELGDGSPGPLEPGERTAAPAEPSVPSGRRQRRRGRSIEREPAGVA